MSRYIGPKNRLSRREGFDLFGKGYKLRRSQVPPGQHGPRSYPHFSEYHRQLREKQKTKRIYGIIERQFKRYIEKAKKTGGGTGEVLLQLLERRLDNVIYRLGLAHTRPMARQLVSHRHVLVDSQPVNIPSYQVRPGQVIMLSPTPSQSQTSASVPDIRPPAWLSRSGAVGKVDRLPTRDDIDLPIDEQLIIEFYSR